MAVPSKEEFAELIGGIKNMNTSALNELRVSHPSAEDSFGNLDYLENYLDAYWTILHDKRAILASLPAAKWLTEGQIAERAWKSLRRNDGKISLTCREMAERLHARAQRDWIEDDLYLYPNVTKAEIEDRLAAKNSTEGKADRLVKAVYHYCNYEWLFIERTLASTFSKYFHDELPATYTLKQEDRKRALGTLQDAVNVIQDDLIWASLGVKPPRGLVSRIIDRRMQEALESAGVVSPITRLDATAKERVLAFRLWRTFLQHYKKGKVTAIFNFLLMDGVANQPATEKVVENWVKKWGRAGAKYPL